MKIYLIMYWKRGALNILSLVLLLGSTSLVNTNTTVYFYVAVTGNDSNTGTLQAPFATFQKAQQAVKAFKSSHLAFKGKVSVYFREGIYRIEKPLTFSPEDSGSQDCQIEYAAYLNEAVSISGGKVLVSKWEKQPVLQLEGTPDERAIWKLNLTENGSTYTYFRQLFADDKRLSRASTSFLYTAGPLPKFQKSIKPYDFANAGKLKENNLDAWCGFQYSNDDIKNWADLANAEVLTYHSWECSWQKIHQVNPQDHTVIFKSPSRYPIGFFNNTTRYRIENIKEALDNFGEWYLDDANKTLYYYAYPRENPNQKIFTIPRVESLLTLTGNPVNGKFVEYISFKNIKFEHTEYGFNRSPLSAGDKAKAQSKFSWLDFASGYTDSQAAPEAGVAIMLEGARNCNFESCEFAHLGSYAIHINKYSHQNNIKKCVFKDTGAGGIMIGFNERLPIDKGMPPASSPSQNQVSDNYLFNGGLIHPSAVAILIMQANNTMVSHNEIYNYPYTGISCGWTWGNQPNFSNANVIANNHIHHVMTELADGGGIYTLGVQPGAIIRENYIHDIYRKPDAIGSFNNGIFFDENSQGMLVERNVIHTIQNQNIRFNQTDSTKMTWKGNSFNTIKPKNNNMNTVITKAGPQL